MVADQGGVPLVKVISFGLKDTPVDGRLLQAYPVAVHDDGVIISITADFQRVRRQTPLTR